MSALLFLVASVCTIPRAFCLVNDAFWGYHNPPKPSQKAALLGTTETRFFTQTLDHFSVENAGTFQQRYYVNREHYDPSRTCHVFLYIGGEAALAQGSVEAGEIVDVGKKYAPLFVGLEHRFYGLSQPFDDLSTDHLGTLSAEQALEDLANFVVGLYADEGLEQSDCKLFAFGGSYPGNLAAWFRLKYPHLVEGSVASSAPVNARNDFFQYDKFVAAGLSDFNANCAIAVSEAGKYVERVLLNGTEDEGLDLKRSMGCDPNEYLMPDVDFLYILSDAVAAAVQYDSNFGGIARVCGAFLNNVTGEPVDDGKIVHAWVDFTSWVFSVFGSECASFTTTTNVLTNTSFTESSNLRQWWWQSCTEFGYFQIAPTDGLSVRPASISLQYHFDLCDAAFGDAGRSLRPDVDGTNARYGGLNLAGTRILLPNGSVDPWTALGVTNSTPNLELIAEVIEGTSHCADLAPAKPTDPPSLVAARTNIEAKVDEWLL